MQNFPLFFFLMSIWQLCNLQRSQRQYKSHLVIEIPLPTLQKPVAPFARARVVTLDAPLAPPDGRRADGGRRGGARAQEHARGMLTLLLRHVHGVHGEGG